MRVLSIYIYTYTYIYMYIYIYIYYVEYLLKGNTLVANGCYRFIYTIFGICVVLLDLVEYSQKNEIYFLYHSY